MKPDSEREGWLANLKAGDEVARKMSGGWDNYIHADFMTVTRCTEKYIFLGTQKFRKDDGREAGTGYRGYRLARPTAEPKAAIAEQSRKSELLSLVDKVRWRELSVATLETILALTKDETPEREAEIDQD